MLNEFIGTMNYFCKIVIKFVAIISCFHTTTTKAAVTLAYFRKIIIKFVAIMAYSNTTFTKVHSPAAVSTPTV